MTQFFAYTQSEYVRQMRKFLGHHHPAVKALKKERAAGALGRIPNYSNDIIRMLEEAVNETAGRCEASDTSFKERLGLALSYTGFKDAALARQLGVCRQVVSGWRCGAWKPSRLDGLAVTLNVPVAWLQNGGEEYLPANSHLGVRVGNDSLLYRESLYSLTINAIQDISDDAAFDVINSAINEMLFKDPAMSKLARQAGGAWLIQEGNLAFVPWKPIAEHGLSRRVWSDKVEAIISDALSQHDSVYAAHRAIKEACDLIGEPHPKKISLYKRLERQRSREAAFGLNQEQVSHLQAT